jgi:exo-poly-alpha-galacturonosidase
MKRTFFLSGLIIVLLFYFASGLFASDNIADMNDLAVLCEFWLVNDCNQTAGVDLNGDCKVNFLEFSVLADNWMQEYPSVASPQNLMVPPMAYDDSSIILIWSKPAVYSNIAGYNVYKNGLLLGNTTKLFYNVTGLTAATSYSFTVKSVNASGTELGTSNTCSKTTANTPAVFYPEDYGAAANGTTKDTAAIQAAINACSAGGKVHLRAGKTFLSGAIFLKSNMTLQIDGTLLGSNSAADYNWTCWRFPYYASGKNYMGLINAYYDYTNPNSYGQPYGSITNVRICGSGVVNGCQGYSASSPHTILSHGLTTLGTAETSAHGDSSRGDMINIKGINQVYVGGWGGTLTLVYPAMHTIFISYCNGVTVNAVNCDTYDIHNGDGINLCTSDTAYIFNSAFDTGDDCINMNAGQGQEGVDDGYPDQNIRVFNCTTQRGHGGYVIGSFTAAWVQDSLVEDCTFNGTDKGIRMKTGSNNGGGGRRITCRDITITNVVNEGIFLDSTYPASGYTSAGPGQFSYNTFKNISVTSTKESIYINGLSGTPHTQNTFSNITGNKAAYLNYCTNSTFTDVNVPSWTIGLGCSGNTSSGCPGCPF